MVKLGAPGLAADLETDGEGRFVAPELDAGEYHIEISRPNYVSATLRLNLTGAELSSTVRLIRCAAVTGQVTDRGGQPVRGATVFALAKPAGETPPERDFTPGHYSAADARGNYRLFNLPPGQYQIAVSYGASSTTVGSMGDTPAATAYGSGFQFYPSNARPQWLALAPGEERRNLGFQVYGAALFSLSGKVDFADPKASFWLALSSPEQPAIAVAVAIADKTGNFRFNGIPSGSYNLFASGPAGGYGGRGAVLAADPVFVRVPVTIGGQNVAGLRVAPEKGRPVRFTLRLASSSSGGPAACPTAAKLALSPTEDWAANIGATVNVKSGSEETVSLAPSRYSMTVSGLGETCVNVSEPVLDLTGAGAANPVTISIAPAGSIRGRLDTGGQPPSDFAIVLTSADSLDPANRVLATVPDAASKFAFTNLRPGKYRIAAHPAGEATSARWLADAQTLEVEMRGGSTVEIDLAAPAPEKKP